MSEVAVLGWGSLIWDPQNLKVQGNWEADGPTLPLEFSRISRNGRLTLVVDPQNGERLVSLWALSSLPTLADAVKNLADRENTSEQNIGVVERNRVVRARYPVVGQDIRTWAQGKDLDAVIWTDLPSNFQDRSNQPFSLSNAKAYLTGLVPPALQLAKEYMQKAPRQIATRLRKHMSSWLQSP